MALVANSSGVIKGKFPIPAGVRAGTKSVTLEGSGGSKGDAVFVGQGALVTTVLQNTNRVTTTYVDPLAQTFSLTEQTQLAGVELFVVKKATTPIEVQIRETLVGLPTQSILASGTINPSDMPGDSYWTGWKFNVPATLQPNVEYALVVLCNDAIGEIGIAELGKWDFANQSWVTQQPYQVGTLLSSSNASTWTAHQDRDMAFRLLVRRYAPGTQLVDLGNIPVTAATDLVILSMADNPATGADSEVRLTMPDNSVITASDGQHVQFSAPVTGNIGVKAALRSTANASAVLYPGSQVVAGAVTLTANYVTRAIDADAAGVKVRVIFNANLPSGANVVPSVRGSDASDPWVGMTQDGVAKAVGDGVYEYQYVLTNVKKARVQVKLDLSGTVAARPFVYNLRVSVV